MIAQSPDLPEHDPCGPSSLGRLIACPASYQLSANEPEIQTDYSREGDELHLLFRRWRKSGEFPKATPEEHREFVLDCGRFVDEKVAGRQIIDEWCEEKVEVLYNGTTILNHGTVDLAILTPGRLFVFDWKFGRLIHRHSLVLQLANYTVAVMQTLVNPLGKKKPPLAADGWAYFPRLSKSFHWETSDLAAETQHVVDKIDSIIADAEEDTSEARPGPWCDYCRHLPNCEAVKQTTKALSAQPDMLLAVPEKVAEVYDAGNLAVKQFDALKARIREVLAERPDALPGLELREVNGRRRVVDLERLREEVLRHCFFTELEFDDLIEKTVRPVALEESFLRKHYTGREGQTKKALRRRLAEVAGETIYQPTEKRLRRTEDDG